jgi:hypothetical protein
MLTKLYTGPEFMCCGTENSNEILVSVKGIKFVDELSDCQFIRKS